MAPPWLDALLRRTVIFCAILAALLLALQSTFVMSMNTAPEMYLELRWFGFSIGGGAGLTDNPACPIGFLPCPLTAPVPGRLSYVTSFFWSTPYFSTYYRTSQVPFSP